MGRQPGNENRNGSEKYCFFFAVSEIFGGFLNHDFDVR